VDLEESQPTTSSIPMESNTEKSSFNLTPEQRSIKRMLDVIKISENDKKLKCSHEDCLVFSQIVLERLLVA